MSAVAVFEDSELQATDNARLYVQEAKLPTLRYGTPAPEFPARGHKSHKNHLTITYERWRRLQRVYGFKKFAFKSLVDTCAFLTVC